MFRLRTVRITAFLAMISAFFGVIPAKSADCSLAIGRPFKAKESATVYYIDSACSKRAIKNEAVYFSHFASWKDVKTVSAAVLLKVPDSRLSFLPWGPNKTFQSGTVMKTIDDPRVYLLIQDTVFPISSEHVFKAMGFSLAWVEDVAPEALSRYLRGPVVIGPSNYPNGMAFKYANGAEVYYLINHQLGPRKWRVLSVAQLRKNYRPDRVATLPNSLQFADADLTLILPPPPADNKTKELSLPAIMPALANFRDNDANRASPIGVNLSRVRYYETSWPFIDAMKNGSPWLTQTAHGEIWDTKEPLDLDSAGWIKSLPQAADSTYQYRRAATHLFVNSGRYPAGKYIVLYDGEGTLEYVNDGVKIASESRPGRDVVDVSAPNEGIVIVISATDPKKNGNYLRNIRVIMPGGICNNNPFVWQSDGTACKGKYTALEQAADTLIFHPEFLAGLSKNRVIRFTHAANIAENETTIWGERPKLSDRIWNDEIRGWPEELYPVLASILSADAWFSMPYRASDDYVRSFARMAKAVLNKNQTIYIEYSADGWDQGRKASQYMAAQAKREWDFVTGNAYLNGLHWYGKRSVEVCDIWKNEFGDERGRVKCVVSGLVSYQYVNMEILDCTLWSAHGGRLCGSNLDVLAVAPYFGWFTGANNRPAMRSWMKEPDGGFNRFFTEVFVGGDLFRNTGENQWGITAHPSGPITDVLEQISQTKKIADKYKLDLVAYEGGQRFLALDPADADIADFFNRANRDPRMGMVYEKYLQGWKANGGHLFMHYADVQKSDRWGSYGLREYQDQPRAKAPKFDALLKFAEGNNCWWSGCERK